MRETHYKGYTIVIHEGVCEIKKDNSPWGFANSEHEAQNLIDQYIADERLSRQEFMLPVY